MRVLANAVTNRGFLCHVCVRLPFACPYNPIACLDGLKRPNSSIDKCRLHAGRCLLHSCEELLETCPHTRAQRCKSYLRVRNRRLWNCILRRHCQPEAPPACHAHRVYRMCMNVCVCVCVCVFSRVCECLW